MVNAYLIVSAAVAFIAIALGAAYMSGALDPVIEKFGTWFFNEKAEAEEKKLQAQGLKEGEDFMKSELLFTSYFWLLFLPFAVIYFVA